MDPALHARAKKIIDEVLDLPEDSRGVALDAACSGDPKLRAHIDKLLAAIVREDRFLSGPTMMEGVRGTMGGSAGASGGIFGARAEGERAGARIGPYKLLEKIGEGGFGTVFMAEQSAPIHRRMALKIIKLGMDTRAVVARFEQERQALAMMDHPNIAKVLDAGATELGRPFFVMELVKGEPITVFADEKKLGIRERLELFTQVCRAVQHAHTKGIIHRDIKPTNVLVAMADGKPLCKVIDFGIAKATQRPLTDKTIFTEFKQLVGTPEYMSPEQAGGSLDIDTRTDVYSLGVMLYELLAGVTPFDPERLRSAAFGELQRIIREDEPQRPSTRVSAATEKLPSIAAVRDVEPKRLGAVIRGELDWIVMRALEKDRARRYETAGNLAADVERYLTGAEVEAAPPSVVYRLRKTMKRHRVGVLTGGLVGAALVVGLAASLWQAGVAKRERDAARAAVVEAEKSRAETERVAGFQSAQLASINVPGMGQRLRGDILESAGLVQARDGVPADEIQKRRGQMVSLLGDVNFTDVALRTLDADYFERAIAAARRELASQPLVRARLLLSIGGTMHDLGLRDRAGPALAEALEIRRRELGSDHRETIMAISSLGILRMSQGAHEEGEKLLREATDRARASLGPDDSVTLNAQNNLGLLLFYASRYEESEKLYRETLAARLRTVGPEDLGTIKAKSNLALVISARGRIDEAIPIWQQTIAAHRRLQGDEHRDTLAAMSNYANDLIRVDRFAEAEALTKETLEIMRRRYGEDHPDTLAAMKQIGQDRKLRNDYVGAEMMDRERLAACVRALGEDHPETLLARRELGDSLAGQGRAADALPYLQAALAGQERRFGKEALPTTLSRLSYGDALANVSRFAEAEKELLMTERVMSVSGHASNDGILRPLVTMYEAWEKAEPGKGYGRKAAEWRERMGK